MSRRRFDEAKWSVTGGNVEGHLHCPATHPFAVLLKVFGVGGLHELNGRLPGEVWACGDRLIDDVGCQIFDTAPDNELVVELAGKRGGRRPPIAMATPFCPLWAATRRT